MKKKEVEKRKFHITVMIEKISGFEVALMTYCTYCVL